MRETILDSVQFLWAAFLAEVVSEKYLGVMFSSDLKVGVQCREVYNRASQSLGLIHRIIKHKNQSILVPLYKSIARPHLE